MSYDQCDYNFNYPPLNASISGLGEMGPQTDDFCNSYIGNYSNQLKQGDS